MVASVHRSIPHYPKSPKEWREWIRDNLGINEEEAIRMSLKCAFPFDKLVDCWRREFHSQKGYSPDFIPALVRNQRGLIKWVYAKGREPVWTGEDSTR
jgi:hypothetical protein